MCWLGGCLLYRFALIAWVIGAAPWTAGAAAFLGFAILPLDWALWRALRPRGETTSREAGRRASAYCFRQGFPAVRGGGNL